MDYERFCDCVNQAADLGYSDFQLTPLTGEVFVDKGIFDKLDFLERHANVRAYGFFTNFTLVHEDMIERLCTLEKLRSLTISLYGHDKSSFVAITGSRERVYEDLLTNLRAIETRIQRLPFELRIGWRTEQGVDLTGRARSDLIVIVQRLRKLHGVKVSISREYNNWGGLIRQEDLEGLNIHIRPPGAVYKKGACTLIFSRMLITADGRINACACRDVDGTLCIGDLKQQPLREILSTRNERYMKLIEDQQQGRFSCVCRACDMYKSVYRARAAYKSHRQRPMTLQQFLEELRGRG
jgi:MoaA/NifB/PqqE/SkfB family radical SAM enzyme